MNELHDDAVQKCLWDEDSQCVTLVRLFVKPECRRQGAGTRMVKAVQAIAKAKRKRVILTAQPETPEGFHDLVRFYKRLGFSMMRDNETMIWSP